MDSETGTCQNCKQPFDIEPEDFRFYERIQVPPPTFCPKCRFQRRLAFFNLFNLYKRPCDLCKKESVSRYAPTAPYTVYCPECWWSDKWNPLDYGRDYDFSRPFFEQLNELWHEVPLLTLSIDILSSKSSPYNNHAGQLNNCYLLFWSYSNEDCAYGTYVINSKTLIDCSFLMLCDSAYDLTYAYKTSHAIGSYNLSESINCAFLRDSENCQNCFASANLRHKKYYLFNKPYAKEEYFEELKKWDLGSYRTYQEVKRLAEAHWKKFPPLPIQEKFATDCRGNRIYDSRNCKECFEVAGAADSKYLAFLFQPPAANCYDVSGFGDNMTWCYECGIAGAGAHQVKFSQESGGGLRDAEYCIYSSGGSHHFGCVSMKKGQYLILNKQYDEESFQRLRAKIIEQMNTQPYIDKRGRVYRYGEFFPIELSPFAYNETMAQNFFPLTPAAAGGEGYRWAEEEVRNYQITKAAADLPDHIKDASNSILEEVIGCASCGRGFKIIRMELDFLRRMNLPLPRRCPFCRLQEKLGSWAKEFRLTKRSCNRCGAEFETPYLKAGADYILCKKCYFQEVA